MTAHETSLVAAVKILLVEDDPGDVLITTEALQRTKLLHELHTVSDGEQALQFLRHEGDYRDALDRI